MKSIHHHQRNYPFRQHAEIMVFNGKEGYSSTPQTAGVVRLGEGRSWHLI
jgi:hypothetical protein